MSQSQPKIRQMRVEDTVLHPSVHHICPNHSLKKDR
jgi:hypothetical protein